jgi:hypothetical protein
VAETQVGCPSLNISDRSSYSVCQPGASQLEKLKPYEVLYILGVPSASGPLHYLLAAPTQPWQAEAFSIAEIRYTKAESAIRFATRFFTLDYLLDCAIHDVADNGDFFVLAKTQNTSDSLLFNGGIPLWF